MVGKLLDDAELSLFRSVFKPGELKGLMHPLAKSSLHHWTLSRQKESEKHLEPTMRRSARYASLS